jgi:Family of unknown function (DUF6166)
MIINLRGNKESRAVWLNGKKLSPGKSQKVYNHSPDGFSWGFNGSGPSQLALAICIELNIQNLYQEFRRLYIASLPDSDFDVEIDISQLMRHRQ